MASLRLIGEQEGGSDDHAALTNLDFPSASHTGFVASDGQAGGQTVKGGTAASENLILESTAHATKGYVKSNDKVLIRSIPDAYTTGLLFNPRLADQGAEYGAYVAWGSGYLTGANQILAAVYGAAQVTGRGATGLNATGLYYQVRIVKEASVSEAKGVNASVFGFWLQADTDNIYQFYTPDFGASNYPGHSRTISNCHGLYIGDMGNSAVDVTNAFGIKVADQTGADNNYILELGPTPYMRLLGSGSWTPTANQTPLYLAEGATPTLRQVRWKAGNALDESDKVMVLV